MTKFEELLQLYVNAEYNELLSTAKNTVNFLLPYCSKFCPGENGGKNLILSIILAAVAADGTLSLTERRFVCELLNIPEEYLISSIRAYSSQMADIADSFADSSDDRVKVDVLRLVICVAACDEKIAHKETEFIRRILR